MAFQLKLVGQRLPFLWNVSEKVGDSKPCPNKRTDVELVSCLLEYIANTSTESYTPANSRIIIGGDFNVQIAYHIYNIQAGRNYYFSKPVDGIISPAKHYDTNKWTIAYLNAVMHETNHHTFMNLDSNPRLSAQLRAELSGANKRIV